MGSEPRVTEVCKLELRGGLEAVPQWRGPGGGRWPLGPSLQPGQASRCPREGPLRAAVAGAQGDGPGHIGRGPRRPPQGWDQGTPLSLGIGDGLQAQAGEERVEVGRPGAHPGQGAVQTRPLALQDVPLQPRRVQRLLGRHQFCLEPRDRPLQLLQAPLTETQKQRAGGVRPPQDESRATCGARSQGDRPWLPPRRGAPEEHGSPACLESLPSWAWVCLLGPGRQPGPAEGTHAAAHPGGAQVLGWVCPGWGGWHWAGLGVGV